jgi:hypothetical protein
MIQTRKQENIELGKAFLIFILLFFMFIFINFAIQGLSNN